MDVLPLGPNSRRSTTCGDTLNHGADTSNQCALNWKLRLREGGEGIQSHKAYKWPDFMQMVARVTVPRSAGQTRPGFSLAPHTGRIWKKSKFYQTPSKTQPQ